MDAKATEIYKDFAQRLRRLTLSNVYIIVIPEDVTQQYKKYVRLLLEIKLSEDCYNAYYGITKKILNSFVSYYTHMMDRFIVGTDKHLNMPDKNEIIFLLEQTMGIHVDQQINFGKDYLPVQSAEERQNYDDIESKFEDFKLRFDGLRQRVDRLDKQDKVDDFAKEHFQYALDKTSEVFDFVHIYIAMLLIGRVKEIRISLEEIYLRLKNNLRQIDEDCDQAMNTLMHNLYDQNKELMTVSRMYRKNSSDIAEVTRSIEKTREQLDVFKYEVPQSKLVEEVGYWKIRLRDFEEVAELIKKLQAEQVDVEKQRALYNSRRCTEYPGSKAYCWKQIGKSFDERSALLKDKLIEAGKALLTFFAIKGADRIFYESDLGKYFVDEFDHQIYVEDYGLRLYHTNCKGEFKEIPDIAQYRFNEYGRYIYDDKGDKTYQVAACTSQYKLDEDQLLKKITKDCGHSEAVNRKCKMRIKDPNDVEVLPDIGEINIKKSLDPEVVKYLWDTFGHILPDALRDLLHDHSKNPIHHLAHRLLHYKKRQWNQ
ncbi:uncharacterized protein LOC128676855 isoform X2 [Plodia interpunctella]|uniref:uncharacterized protein LOC128676855 isoform X2 n=1 Tax=Plodia interpunctella TaxID=58824 RepID=UPI002367F134|nr:uncharacterized protein LOC128676855 isoform X2 [Plodia interpunctella]